MILNNGQNMVQPSSGGGGGGLRRLVDIIARNKSMEIAFQNRKDLVTHTTEERVREQKLRGEVGIKHLLAAHDATQEKYAPNHPDVLAGNAEAGGFIRPHLAEDVQLGGLQIDNKGQPQSGPVAGIKRTGEVTKRKKDAATAAAATKAAATKAAATKAAATKAAATKAAATKAAAGRVNSNVDRLEKK